MSDHTDAMTRFKRAFAKADATLLAEAITDDFVWHTHWSPGDRPQATGTVLSGLDEVIAEIRWRAANWSDVRFEGVEERFVDDRVVQTFTISGTDETGRAFEVDAVDLYRVVDGRLALKDTYWKQTAERHEGE